MYTENDPEPATGIQIRILKIASRTSEQTRKNPGGV